MSVISIEECDEFYAIQVTPDLDEKRIVFGITGKNQTYRFVRTAPIRYVVPRAKVLYIWPCHRTWVHDAVDYITKYSEAELIEDRLFSCVPEDVVRCGNDFFQSKFFLPRENMIGLNSDQIRVGDSYLKYMVKIRTQVLGV